MDYIVKGTILNVKDGIKKIDNNTFENLSEVITEIILPEGVEIIEDATFFDNVNLEKIHLPSTLTEIGTNSFWGLDELKYIYIPKSVKVIKDDAFVNCKNCIILVEGNEDSYSKNWYKNVKEIKFNISHDDLREEVIKILYSFNKTLTEDDKKAFSMFTIEILKMFPNFEYNDELNLAYILAGAFVSYMESLIGFDEDELDKALKYIEKLHKSKNQRIKELATIGFVESIQNSWSKDNKMFIYPKLGLQTKKSWKTLNRFWEDK